MDRPFIRVSANDKYDRMVGIQITDRIFKTFYPGKKEPTILYHGPEPYCKIYGTCDVSYVGNDYTFTDAPLVLYDYDYIEFEFKDKKITNEDMFLSDFINIIWPYIRYYWEIDALNSLE
jgi:hypothetical protein